MTKREFVNLKEGDEVLAIRHILDDEGNIVVAENSEWKINDIELIHFKGQGRKPKRTIHIVNLVDGKKFEISKENSANFLLLKKKKNHLKKQ